MRRILAAVLSLGLASLPMLAAAAASDAEVKKGIQQVDDGEYDTAILTLDAAARRLASAPGATEDLAQAYLYLGIAYLAKGQEISARVRFREAVKQARDLSLPPDKFAPKVIEEFERAREDVRNATPAPAEKKKGGSKKWLLIGGGAAAAGAFLAFGPQSKPEDPNAYFSTSGLLTPTDFRNQFTIGPGGAGRWKVHMSWTDRIADVKMQVFDSTGAIYLGDPRLVELGRRELEFEGSAGTYQVFVQLVTPLPSGAVSPVPYELSAEFPKP
jgi:hypothetical protein